MVKREHAAEFYEHKGVPFEAQYISKERLLALEAYEDIREDDVVVCRYPKSGTHWIGDIANKIMRNGDLERAKENKSESLYFEKYVPPELAAQLNPDLPKASAASLEELSMISSPRIINTNLPFHLLPPQVQQGKCKVIYIYRDPRDSAVSYWHHLERIRDRTKDRKKHDSWPGVLQMFMDGKVSYGSWFNHFISYQEKHGNANVLLLAYEELNEDLHDVVKTISVFLGKTFDDALIEAIATSSTFSASKVAAPHSSLLRSGVDGDWKNTFTVAQSLAFDELLQKMKMSSRIDLPFWPYSEVIPIHGDVQGVFYRYQGVPFPADVVPLKRLQSVYSYADVRSDDVFICTYPKAGTHWVADIANKIAYNGDLEKAREHSPDLHLLEIVPSALPGHQFAPQDLRGLDDLTQLPSPRIILTHLQFRMLPRQVQRGRAKVIYVYRNPRDIAISILHMRNMIHKANPRVPPFSWSDVFEKFLSEDIIFGAWWDHFKNYQDNLEKSHLLCLYYEEMKKDLPGTVRKVADFLGKPITQEVIDKIAASCDIDVTKKEKPKSVFVRKGIAGDWVNYFTVEQSKRFDKKLIELKESMGLDVPY